MTSGDRKEKAQEALLLSMQMAFCNEELTQEELKLMSKQMARVEKLFGYVTYSWVRGC